MKKKGLSSLVFLNQKPKQNLFEPQKNGPKHQPTRTKFGSKNQKTHLHRVISKMMHPPPPTSQIFKPIRKLVTTLIHILRYYKFNLLTYLSLKKIKGHFWSPVHPSVHPHDKGFAGFQKVGFQLCFWNLIFHSLMTINIKRKSIGPHTGVLKHFPLGDKGFFRLRKVGFHVCFWIIKFRSRMGNNLEERIKWTPPECLGTSLRGIKVCQISKNSDILGCFWRPNFGSPNTY